MQHHTRLSERMDTEALTELVDYLGYIRFGKEAQKVLEETSFDIDSNSFLAHRLRVLALHDSINELERSDVAAKSAIRAKIKEKFDDLQSRLSSRFNPKSGAEDGGGYKSTWLDMQIDISREAVLSILGTEYVEGRPFNPETVAAYKDAVNKAFPAHDLDAAAAAADPAHGQLDLERKQLLDVVMPNNVVDELALIKLLKQLAAFPQSLHSFLDTLESAVIPLPRIITRREVHKSNMPSPHGFVAPPGPHAWSMFPATDAFPGLPADAALYAAGIPPPQPPPPPPAATAKSKRKAAIDDDPEYTDDETKRKRAYKKRTPRPPGGGKLVTAKREREMSSPGGLEGAPDLQAMAVVDGMLIGNALPLPNLPMLDPNASLDGAEAGGARGTGGRKRVRFTQIEEENLKRGVEEFGLGKWEEIRRKYWFNDRTNVDLKDKWRNMKKKMDKQAAKDQERMNQELEAHGGGHAHA